MRQSDGVQRREVARLPEAREGFVLLPRRWVVERRCAWTGRYHRLARDDEQLAHTLASMPVMAFGTLLLTRVVEGIFKVHHTPWLLLSYYL
jgi:transposase